MTPQLIKSNFGNFDAKVYKFQGSIDSSLNSSEQITALFQQLVDEQLNDCVVINEGINFYVYTKQQVELANNDIFILLYETVAEEGASVGEDSNIEEANQQQLLESE